MKKFIALTMAALMLLGLFAGCAASNGGNAGNNGGDATVQTVTPGKLTVAISPDFAPMEFVIYTEDGSTEYAGFDVMLAEYLAKKFDATEYGGSPFLGISKPVVKAHGSSNAKAFANAIRAAVNYAESGVIYDIAEEAERFSAAKKAEREAQKAAEATGEVNV